jgi:hypothetical protein
MKNKGEFTINAMILVNQIKNNLNKLATNQRHLHHIKKNLEIIIKRRCLMSLMIFFFQKCLRIKNNSLKEEMIYINL